MNLTQAHVVAVCLIVICATLLGATHAMGSSDITNIYVAALGSLSGHAVGYAAGQKAIIDTAVHAPHVQVKAAFDADQTDD